MKYVKYICKHCKSVEEYTTREKFFRVCYQIVFGTLAGLGLLFLVFMFLKTPFFPIESVLNARLTEYARANDDELREVALEMTKECDGGDSYCYARALFLNLSRIRYVPTSKYKNIYEPLYTLENGNDCKNQVVLFVSLMHSLGFEARASCNLEHQHCMTVIPHYRIPDRLPGYLVVDLTVPILIHMDDDEDEWSYVKKIKELYGKE